MVEQARHVPVLLDRVLDLLAPALADRDDAVFVDCTLGLGGHSEAVLRAHPKVRLVGLDRDPQAIALSRERLAPFADRVSFVQTTYDGIAEAVGGAEVHGVLMDLGVSSLQLDAEERGFAYSKDAPLDMRMSAGSGMTAADVLNEYPADELTRVLRDYGEERFARKIAGAVVRERAREPFTTSGRLVRLLYDVVPAATRRTGGHPAKRTFQALRIEVNQELESLRAALPAALSVLAVGGRIVVESYQSLEDRMVKRAFADLAASTTPLDLPVELPGHGPQLKLVTRGAEQANEREIEDNPRAASVRLRAAERIREAT
ncbi:MULTISPECIES: 16S rRNA (cytosine(1402)-N(4))-methyltransferase RsmH [Saccharothrix]|uniref:Ribosomal RNA small subunit methyltransferase H n=2 Tax=Saccharothrix TaxID=2071 RepID=A0ABU0XA53_9PSEU|nr:MULTISPECIES: 16S rRNA (cytosine(1402)-N(4))-methyltransferase RsmH [Saccharothrix]MDQ2589012.1 16S rRNA (cytosine(1402)-N(4))-methyltransferase [Saccharothrix yanglingensis]MDR6595974.1 16S rRNA (cytosine1402-N4)-methyltransferase [Saccharothrix longispora]MDU0289941.1 16S rRNA (cytosine(1402)-N(4))-methyltransferase RsmH [Saccharothrix longispora]